MTKNNLIKCTCVRQVPECIAKHTGWLLRSRPMLYMHPAVFFVTALQHRLYTLLHFAFSNSNYTLHFIIQSKRSFGLMDKWLGCLGLLLVCSLFRFQIAAAGLTGHLQNGEDCGRLGACGRLQTMFEKRKKKKDNIYTDI